MFWSLPVGPSGRVWSVAWSMIRAAALLPSLAIPASALDTLVVQEPAPVSCRACGSTGRIDCTKHGKGWLEREHAVRFCSQAAECKACGGALAVDCKQCRNAAAEAELAARLEAVRKWRAARKAGIDDLAKGEPMLHLETTHLDLGFGCKALTVGRDKLDTHEAMHLYGDRIETLYSLFSTTLGLTDRDFSARLRVYVCRDEQQCSTLAPRVTGIGGNHAVGTKLMGVEAVYCMWQNPRTLPDDEALHRNIVHNLVHLLLSNMAPARYFGNPGNGWIDEGLAHWFEDKIGGKCTNFCFEEVLQQDGASFKGGRWRVPVRKMCDDGKLQSLSVLAPKNTDQLTFPEHAQAFAMVDYLMVTRGGESMRDFVRQIKGDKPMRDAMQAVYSTNPLSFDREFETWVRSTYPPQEPPR